LSLAYFTGTVRCTARQLERGHRHVQRGRQIDGVSVSFFWGILEKKPNRVLVYVDGKIWPAFGSVHGKCIF
jgi:hypothetical protein